MGRMLALCLETVKLWWDLLFGMVGRVDGEPADVLQQGTTGVSRDPS